MIEEYDGYHPYLLFIEEVPCDGCIYARSLSEAIQKIDSELVEVLESEKLAVVRLQQLPELSCMLERITKQLARSFDGKGSQEGLYGNPLLGISDSTH